MNPARALIWSIVLAAFQPRPRGTIAQWVKAQRIIISSKENQTFANQQLDPARTPCVSSLLLSFLHPNDQARELHFIKSAQSSASVNAILGFGWRAQHAPGNCLYVIDTAGQGRDFSTERVDGLLRSIPHTNDALEANEKSQRAFTKSFPNCTLYLCGAQSAGSITSKPIAIGIGDEVERHPILNGATTTDLLRTRLTGSDESKLLQFSTPEIHAQFEEDDKGRKKWMPQEGSQLHKEYLSGTQEKCHVPCPYCGTYQEITWEKIHFEHCKLQEELPLPGSSTIYDQAKLDTEIYCLCDNELCRATGPESTTPTACESAHWNHGKILETHKPWMVAIGRHRWTPTPEDQRERRDIYPTAYPHRRSAQLSSLYDIAFRSLRWGNLVREWLEAQGDPTKLRHFLNNRLGRPFSQHATEKLTVSEIAHHVSTNPHHRRLHLEDTTKRHRHTDLPIIPHHISLFVDVQQSVFKWLLVCFSNEQRHPDTNHILQKAGEIYILDWGTIPHDADREWQNRLDDLTQTILWPPGSPAGGGVNTSLPCQCIIDCRYRTIEILSFCFQRPWWQPISGEGHNEIIQGRPYWMRPTLIQDNKIGGKKIPGHGKEIDVLCLDANYWARELMQNRFGQTNFQHPNNSPRIHLPNDILAYPGFIAEILNAQETYVKTSNGRLRQLRWTKVHSGAPDDYHDCLKWAPLQWAITTES